MDSFHARAFRTKPAVKPSRDASHRGVARVDAALVAQGVAPSRAAAQRLIEAGRVSWVKDGSIHAVRKPAEVCPEGARFMLTAGPDKGRNIE